MTWPWEIVERDQDRGYVALDETVARFEGGGFATSGVIGASDDDWDHYESQHWRAIEEWLAEHPDGPGAGEFRARHERSRREYFVFKRALLGWAIFVGRKP